ncbi:MAG: GWxTD domain-containing protein [Ignavibacteria bacterium]
MRYSNPDEFLPNFYADAYNYHGSKPGKSRVDVYVEVPFEGIQFIKSARGFMAGYSVTVSFFDESKEKLIKEKIWNETVTSPAFEPTASSQNYNISVKSFELDPAVYSVRIAVEDKESRKEAVKENMFTVRDMTPKPVSVSDILLIDREIIVDGNKKIIPNILRNLAAKKEGLMIYYELYADTAEVISAVYSINNKENHVIYSKTLELPIKKGLNAVNYSLDNSELSMGEYSVMLSFRDGSGKVLCKTSRKFISKWAGLPASVNDIDKAVDQLIYIAKPKELAEIKGAGTKQEKQEMFQKFWRRKDPVPDTEENEVFDEYYRRVAYANEHFRNYMEGWKTDMGMVFITLGPPGNIARYPYEMNSKPYEIWSYYDINKEFIFIDQTGFGDYRLQNPVYGSWWKYRQ